MMFLSSGSHHKECSSCEKRKDQFFTLAPPFLQLSNLMLKSPMTQPTDTQTEIGRFPELVRMLAMFLHVTTLAVACATLRVFLKVVYHVRTD